jgi:hypothetical protein
MNRDRRSSSNDPTAERVSDQPTQSAPGLSSGADLGGIARHPEDDELLYRGPLHVPRRYDQPIEDDDDPVMPSDDSTLNTKI